MKYHLLAAWLVIASVFVGCKPAEPPAEGPIAPAAEDTSPDSTDPSDSSATNDSQAAAEETTGEMDKVDAAETEAASDDAADVPAYTAEQIAAAKQLAVDLGVVVKEDAEGNVVAIDTAANRSWVDDYQMQEMLVFPKLTSLTLEGPSITDALAPRIAEQAQLTSLALRNTLLGDQGIAQFQTLKKLKIIDLRVSPMVTDAAMQVLADLPDLRAVRVNSCNVSDQGLEVLANYENLQRLTLRDVPAKGAALAKLPNPDKLVSLNMAQSGIGDGEVAHLAGMTNLENLNLSETTLTDACVEGLAKLNSLKQLVLTQTGVTAEGAKRLVEALPDCTIQVD